MKLRDKIQQLRIIVVGDVMLDEYWFGDVHRISPEAPVPIVRIARSEERPGGAANVGRNLAALGAKVTLLSVVGADNAADRLRAVLDEAGIDHRLQTDPEIRTTVKLRVIGQQQQMLRIDFEDAPSAEALDQKKAQFEESLASASLVIFSDYRKGSLRHIEDLIERVRARGKMILVDPKGEDYERYSGATAITPNRSEFTAIAGGWNSAQELEDKAQKLRRSLGLEALLVTMSEQGMILFREDSVFHKPAQAREVFDVSGAGDTVIAALGVMLAAGASWEHAVDFANAAAGLVVSKLGTSVATFEEVSQLFDDIENWPLTP
ncbi:D-glycero-beta-D-manno-heptose-7-phosphate kinase [Sphingomonas sp. AAP5]|uniref:D-glycero-beta-D-manno-heptose-7-phosphate kinase n=1 Tax=Sphingomonas sp. AAP5 TaxID=1523415 RepID=UPI001056E72F|nr:D-glycero-beta-D-manno-heptose-7-phosphate kinase [Sphingomonas sp. AAP5]QBM76831.1 D-glycero-beta-D-manno-heptose-7-phosphate kinase [Sphingomonas sp. AAP5]